MRERGREGESEMEGKAFTVITTLTRGALGQDEAVTLKSDFNYSRKINKILFSIISLICA